MLYTTFTVNDKEYKLRLNAKACVDLEKKLNKNPLNVLMSAQNGELPTLETMILILHASMQAYQHEISLDDTYGIYDEFVNEGGLLTDLFNVIVEIFEVSGFFHRSKEDEGKNSKKRVKG